MSTTQHPLTDTPADPHHDPRPWQDCTREDIREGDLVERPCLGVVRVGVAHHQDEEGDWRARNGWVLTCGDRWPLRRIPAHTTEKETPMTETTTTAEPLARTLLAVPEGYGAPHHDAEKIRREDFVLQVDEDGTTRGGRAHHQDEDGDWLTEDDRWITYAAIRADRPDAVTVWPAPTPPAEEVEMPGEFGAVITDVEDWNGETYDRLAFLGLAFEDAVDKVHPDELTAFTLPDGTRARRDGEHANGEPRFVKESA